MLAPRPIIPVPRLACSHQLHGWRTLRLTARSATQLSAEERKEAASDLVPAVMEAMKAHPTVVAVQESGSRVLVGLAQAAQAADAAGGGASGASGAAVAEKAEEEWEEVVEEVVVDDALAEGWEELQTEEGYAYYYNGASGESAWEKPLAPPTTVQKVVRVKKQASGSAVTAAAASGGATTGHETHADIVAQFTANGVVEHAVANLTQPKIASSAEVCSLAIDLAVHACAGDGATAAVKAAGGLEAALAAFGRHPDDPMVLGAFRGLIEVTKPHKVACGVICV